MTILAHDSVTRGGNLSFIDIISHALFLSRLSRLLSSLLLYQYIVGRLPLSISLSKASTFVSKEFLDSFLAFSVVVFLGSFSMSVSPEAMNEEKLGDEF